jgi:hypothetical protein
MEEYKMVRLTINTRLKKHYMIDALDHLTGRWIFYHETLPKWINHESTMTKLYSFGGIKYGEFANGVYILYLNQENCNQVLEWIYSIKVIERLVR